MSECRDNVGHTFPVEVRGAFGLNAVRSMGRGRGFQSREWPVQAEPRPHQPCTADLPASQAQGREGMMPQDGVL